MSSATVGDEGIGLFSDVSNGSTALDTGGSAPLPQSFGPNSPTSCRLLTARAVAELLDVCAETVLRWIRNGELPAIRLPGGAIRIIERLPHATRAFGKVPLGELERMGGEIATWQSKLPERSRYGLVQALRQVLEAGVRWGYISRNPAKLAGRNRQASPRTVRAYTHGELDAIAAELSPRYQPLPVFAAATGLRPEEWQALERRDINRRAGVLNVLRTVSDGEIVELAKNHRSRRQVPLSKRALASLDALPPRLDTPRLFPAPKGGLLNLDHFRARERRPAIVASGVRQPARIYDLRATFASTAIRAGVPVFELAKIMGTSVRMIELHYGSLLDGAAAAIASRLDAYEDEQHDAGDWATDDV